MRVRRYTSLLLLFAALTVVINTSCAHRGVLVPNTDYARENDDPAYTYRVTTTDGALYIATEIATTDTTVTILALEHKGDTDLVFGTTRYEDVTLPLTIDRPDIHSLVRLERSMRASIGVAFMAVVVLLAIIGAAGTGMVPSGS